MHITSTMRCEIKGARSGLRSKVQESSLALTLPTKFNYKSLTYMWHWHHWCGSHKS